MLEGWGGSHNFHVVICRMSLKLRMGCPELLITVELDLLGVAAY